MTTIRAAHVDSESNQSHYERELVAAARRDFAWFYARASAGEANLLTALVVAHGAFLVLFNEPREHLAPEVREGMEILTNTVELQFTELRRNVRACPTFAALSADEQAAMERLLFDVWAGWTGDLLK